MRPFAVLLSTTTLAFAAPAFAQNTAPAQPVQQTAPTPDTTAGSTTQQADETPTQDIVVTAQGRAQALADVPVAVWGISAAPRPH